MGPFPSPCCYKELSGPPGAYGPNQQPVGSRNRCAFPHPTSSTTRIYFGTRTRGVEVEALDEALTLLAQVDARKSRVVELRFFGGLTVGETAEVLEISEETALRDWKVAKIWLFRALAQKARGK
ncbi:MAG: hypothetical protein HY820_00740 [Acidobacteria bacterium]|nr:hypothetical protein [Acidobacteriota bacterium]